ncbi:MAG: CHRD domain-containing protein [Flavisolibacter sp.]
MERKTLVLISACVLVLFLLSFLGSCSKNSNNSTTTASTTYTISATMNGAQEVPAVTTSGTGTVTGSYDANTNVLNYSVSWSNLSGPATLGHFHGPAAAGANATVVVPFTLNNNGNTGTASGTATLTDAQETDLLAGKWYANIHTAAYGAGEIRGQVTAIH